MTTNTNTDLTEEDAADLQFPKDKATFYSDKLLNRIPTNCPNCCKELSDRFILCAECDASLCSACFASGVEFDNHRNDHSYRILSNDFPIFEDTNWSAKEELVLLDGLINLGNWSSIAKKLPHRSIKSIQEHYDHFYLSRRGCSALPVVPETDTSLFHQPVVPYRFRLDDIQDPPRYTFTSVGYRSVAGYNAPRSDFELEYDTNAEDLIANLEYVDPGDPDFRVLSELQCAIMRTYNLRLEERQRRRRIIRDHGCILYRKMVSWLRRYDMTITQSVYERLTKFLQFYTGEGFEFLMEGLHRAGELKIQIARLCDFRKRGISSLEAARLYLNLKQNREDSQRDVKTFHSNPVLNMKFRNITSMSLVPSARKRRGTFTPLEIIGMPGYEKLQPKERELCRNVRLVPLSYLELKAVLIAENNKMGFLKLLTARRLLKIDVNKTRRLYDFLVSEGYVKKPNK